MTKLHLMAAAFAALSLAACSSGRVGEIEANLCPAVDVLATADRWIGDGADIRMTGARLTCFADKESGQLQADVVLTGTTTKTGLDVSFFLATLNARNKVVNRTQYKVRANQPQFSFTLPRYTYGVRGDAVSKPRLVVGFVLSKAQLEANRRSYRKRLGLN